MKIVLGVQYGEAGRCGHGTPCIRGQHPIDRRAVLLEEALAKESFVLQIRQGIPDRVHLPLLHEIGQQLGREYAEFQEQLSCGLPQGFPVPHTVIRDLHIAAGRVLGDRRCSRQVVQPLGGPLHGQRGGVDYGLAVHGLPVPYYGQDGSHVLIRLLSLGGPVQRCRFQRRIAYVRRDQGGPHKLEGIRLLLDRGPLVHPGEYLRIVPHIAADGDGFPDRPESPSFLNTLLREDVREQLVLFEGPRNEPSFGVESVHRHVAGPIHRPGDDGIAFGGILRQDLPHPDYVRSLHREECHHLVQRSEGVGQVLRVVQVYGANLYAPGHLPDLHGAYHGVASYQGVDPSVAVSRGQLRPFGCQVRIVQRQ